MLRELQIRNLVLIEDASLTFSPRFNVLTGETGAGKSLIATSLDLLLGDRATSALVRKEAREAEVEGIFDIGDEPLVRAALEEAGLPVDDELLIRRIIPADGRHRCFINGRVASLGVLGTLAAGLATSMSQHAHQELFEPERQLALLDGFAGSGTLLEKVSALFGTLQRQQDDLSQLLSQDRDRAARMDYLAYQLDEFDRVSPQDGEMALLEKELSVLRHQTTLLEGTNACAGELYETDGSIFERLGNLSKSLQQLTRFDPSLEDDARQLQEASILVEEAARSIGRYSRRLEADPARLETLEERRDTLVRLARKHGVDADELAAKAAALRHELASLQTFEDAAKSLQAGLDKARADALAAAQELSRTRHQAAGKFSAAVTGELTALSFDRAAFHADITTDDSLLRSTGIDRVEFTVELNPGEGAHPLRKVASGGELSRMMLALKKTAAGVGPVGTYVFDEVDAGIGGNTARAVAASLADVAAHHQLICITHLAPIAARADAHFHIRKEQEDGRTVTRVTPLTEAQRVEEIARMLGGSADAGMVSAAKELLKAGRLPKKRGAP